MQVIFNEGEERDRLDWQLLQNSPVIRYYKLPVLADDVAWLTTHGYIIKHFNCSEWTSLEVMHDDFSKAFQFPPDYGRNLDAFSDSLSDLKVPTSGGIVLVLKSFDAFVAFNSELARAILEIFAMTARRLMLFGKTILALIQTDSRSLSIGMIGAMPVVDNPKEFAGS